VRSSTIASVVPSFSPMLASSGPVAAPASGWAFEPKFDGWRVLVFIDGDLTVRTRNGHNVTASVPELSSMVAALEGRAVVLDGELVARQGRPFDFYGLAPRLSARAPASVARRQARMPVTFAAFDVLYLDGETVTGQTYLERRALLEGLSLTGPAWCTVLSVVGDGPELMAACGQLGLEGLVAKRVDSIYRPGERSRNWVKAKCPDWRIHHAPRRLSEGRRPHGHSTSWVG
jgi:bifunctional non-homologous end joining protein LigD